MLTLVPIKAFPISPSKTLNLSTIQEFPGKKKGTHRSRMWKLNISKGGSWLKTRSNFLGREVWEFDQELGTNEERANVERAREDFRRNRFNQRQNSDLLMRMQFAKENPSNMTLPQVKVEDNKDVTEEAVTITLRRAINYFSTIQANDGHWPGDFPGPLFVSAILVIVLYVTKTVNSILSPEHKRELCRYLFNCQNKDGGWGLCTEGPSIMYSTVLCYIALRLLGEGADGGDDGAMEKGRLWILERGGVTMIPTWGKFWLAVLGVFEWSGVNPVPPELVLLPYFIPIHPGRLFCHLRFIYLPMAYLYGKRFVGPITNAVLSLREELHSHPYHMIDWNQARNLCSEEDNIYPRPLIQKICLEVLYKIGEPILANWPISTLRRQALKIIMKWIHYEDENSLYISVGSPQKVLCMLSCWVEDPSSDAFKYHAARISDFLWPAEDGMKMRVETENLQSAIFAVFINTNGDIPLFYDRY